MSDDLATEQIRYLGDVQKLALNPGDIIVVQSPDLMSESASAGLRQYLRSMFPHHDVLILDGGLQLGVLEQPEMPW